LIYFDNAATTQPLFSPYIFYNPSSPHQLGIKAERALRNARSQITSCLVANNSASSSIAARTSLTSGDLLFTSGGTESNNLAIIGYSLANYRQPVVISCAQYEHPSLIAPMRYAMQRYGQMQDTSTASMTVLSHVNHETGDINDIAQIAADIKAGNSSAIIFVDGAQGFCKERICLDMIDLYSFSSHKVHGPHGVGGLWMRKGVKLSPLVHGGEQENGLRSGTENVEGVVQLAEVVSSLHVNMDKNRSHISKINTIMRSLQEELPHTTVNTLSSNTSPYILNMSFIGVKGEILTHALSEQGLCVSMGAACRSRKTGKTALELMGFSPEIAASAIRFSFSHLNTEEEAHTAKALVLANVLKLRKMKGL